MEPEVVDEAVDDADAPPYMINKKDHKDSPKTNISLLFQKFLMYLFFKYLLLFTFLHQKTKNL